MTAAVIQAPVITPGDRLGLTICIAIIIHTMIVLGISFAPEPVPESLYDALEVILVTRRSEQPPEEADMLAQANLQGGGEHETTERPAAPIEAPLPQPAPEVAAAPAPPVEARTAEPDQADAATVSSDTPSEATEPAARDEPERLVEEAPEAPQPLPKPEPKPQPQVAAKVPVPKPEEPKPEVRSRPLPTAAQLITRSFALASLNAELAQRLDMRSKRPRRKFISANTKEYRYAAYMEAWRAKVERIGNLNYPDEARRRDLSGSLLLDVSLNPDGSVRDIVVRRSSGHKALDDAAVRIVKLAAPFAPFPERIAEEVDILHVTRTWRFLDNAKFSAR